jgi:hypothetical protein
MEGESPTQASTQAGPVFLSYASQDAEAAQRICEALRLAGAEVWFDQSELRGGDAWDRQIRTQIHECALFIPIISAHSDARHEGYFRREWRLAVEPVTWPRTSHSCSRLSSTARQTPPPAYRSASEKSSGRVCLPVRHFRHSSSVYSGCWSPPDRSSQRIGQSAAGRSRPNLGTYAKLLPTEAMRRPPTAC